MPKLINLKTNMFRSATLRLTLWYLFIIMAISLLFSVALYRVTDRELNRDLHRESQSIYNQFPVFQNDPNFNIKPAPFYDESSHRILVDLVGCNLIVIVMAGFSSYFLARRTLRPLEAAHTQQKRFTADVSHELRTPLTAIKMESEVALLSPMTPAPELRGVLESNLEEVSKLETLINNLLKLSRLEADELQQNFVEISSEMVVEGAISQLVKIAEQKSVKIKTIGKNIKLYGDIDSLTQLLTILTDNAIKYSPKDSTVIIETDDNKDSVIWRVKDSGSGIALEDLAHVFDRFYRADNSRNKIKAEGYGLGLSIAKMIADVYSGDVTLTSSLETGTTASISIPKHIKSTK